jgi:hypothetical protein
MNGFRKVGELVDIDSLNFILGSSLVSLEFFEIEAIFNLWNLRYPF